MALRSALFAGDPKLEAAAVADSAHIMVGARGSHVSKIQQALISCDSAKITVDGSYGPATANAVLAYKTKRKIINTIYQTQADSVVGKMTIAALDSELLSNEKPVGIRHVEVDYCKLCKSQRHPHDDINNRSFSYKGTR